jgi:uncharacterized protein YjiS (DUF1127 family)
MNTFQFAIASIVDANTGNGLVHNGGKIDYAAAASRGNRIRAKTIITLFGLASRRLSKAIASIRERRAEKRRISQLARLNDHILEDIGISRGDVVALRLGQIDFEQLETRRDQNRSAAARLQPVATTRGIDNRVRRDAFNEAVFAKARCA